MMMADAWAVDEFDENGDVLATYDDWRLPTIEELKTATNIGTIERIYPTNETGGPLYIDGGAWTSQSHGNKAWRVTIDVDVIRGTDEEGRTIVIEWWIVGDGGESLHLKDSGFDAFLVRDPHAGGKTNGGGNGKKR